MVCITVVDRRGFAVMRPVLMKVLAVLVQHTFFLIHKLPRREGASDMSAQNEYGAGSFPYDGYCAITSSAPSHPPSG